MYNSASFDQLPQHGHNPEQPVQQSRVSTDPSPEEFPQTPL